MNVFAGLSNTDIPAPPTTLVLSDVVAVTVRFPPVITNPLSPKLLNTPSLSTLTIFVAAVVVKSLILNSPFTSNFLVGLVVPIPIFWKLSIVIASVLLVINLS